ncbi:GDP-mannose 4,6-dehydratase [Desulfolucanica intricata]|uniref:GDP-mannose 4,6-dehydratase n=1 Tax=Desulfolucanica intricata TaxID=1285191 RepID=UPI000830A680|nr:GDP-mannose 4,6-dehydratase [Desulfolucanica intricata]
MKTILVTGGAGFIGSHLCKALLHKNQKVIIIDNFNDFYDPGIKKNNIVEIKKMMGSNGIDSDNLQVVEGDIRDQENLDKLFIEYKINLIVHLAAMAGVRPSIKNPLVYNDVNIRGTLNLLEMCKKYEVDKFVYASSSSVYGNNEKVPFAESDNVDYPISPYAATKKAGELLCHTYHYLYDIDAACLRFFTVYGPGQRPDLAIHKFTKLIINEQELPFYGDGSTERDYTYIDDIIDGVTKTIDWIQAGKGRYDIFNLGESNTVSLKRMVETLEKVIGKKAKLNILPVQPGDVNRTFADISKSKKVLGYNPTMDFEDGIEKFVAWYKEVNNIN